MATLQRAIEIATCAHREQADKAGQHYYRHIFRVMERGVTENERICGILHDVVEDTPVTFEDLEKEGFSKEVMDALRLVTKESEDENYDHFIDRISTNPLAVKVKLNDLMDNLDITRLEQLTEKDIKRLNKYLKAYRKLIKIRQ